jgi:hypothetical protein
MRLCIFAYQVLPTHGAVEHTRAQSNMGIIRSPEATFRISHVDLTILRVARMATSVTGRRCVIYCAPKKSRVARAA